VHGLDNYNFLPIGECLSQDLAFLESKGMTHTFTMHDIVSVKVNLLNQIVSAFDAVLGNFLPITDLHFLGCNMGKGKTAVSGSPQCHGFLRCHKFTSRECHGFVNPRGLQIRVGRGTGAGWQI
jgi:hypothetical protein